MNKEKCSFTWMTQEYAGDNNTLPIMVEQICNKDADYRDLQENRFLCEAHKNEDMDRKHGDTGSSNPDYNQEDYEDQYETMVGK